MIEAMMDTPPKTKGYRAAWTGAEVTTKAPKSMVAIRVTA